MYTSFKRALTLNTVLLAALPILGFGLIALQFQKRDLEKVIVNESKALAKSATAETRAYLHHALLQLENLTELILADPSVGNIAFNALVEKDIGSPGHFESLLLLDRQGQVRMRGTPPGTDVGAGAIDTNFSNQDIFKNAVNSGKPIWSKTFISTRNNLAAVTLAYPFKNGVILGTINLGPLNDIADRIGEDNGYAYIVNQEGRLIVHPDRSLVTGQEDVSNISIVKGGREGKFGTYRYPFRGVERLGSVVGVPETGWLVAVAERTDVAFAPLVKLQKILLAGMLTAIALAALSAIWSLTRLFKPLTTLIENVQKVSRGDYSFVTPEPSFQEIDRLSVNFNAMAEAVNSREEQLQQRNEELAMAEEELRQQVDEYQRSQDELCETNHALNSLILASPLAIVAFGINGQVKLWNPAAEKMFGWKISDAVGQLCPLACREGADLFWDLCAAVISEERIITIEMSRSRLDGTQLEVAVSAAPLLGADGLLSGVMTVIADITDRKRVDEELRSLNSRLESRVIERTGQLEAANRELATFCYSMSHDLRAPLGHIGSYCQTMLEDCSGLDELGRNCLERMDRISHRLLQLIDGLMDMYRLTRCEMQRDIIDLSDMAIEISGELQSSEPKRHVTFSITPGVTASGDPRLLRIVLQNLLCNAWKYSGKEESPIIEFGCLPTHTGQAFFVSDNGVGFDMAHADRLFAPFSRLHGDDEFSGTGIGLATVQRIVTRHGGQVWAEAESGHGAKFYFTVGTASS